MPSQNFFAPSGKAQPSPVRSAPFEHTHKDQLGAGPHNLLAHRGREFSLVDEPLERYFKLIGQRPCEGTCSAHWEIEDGWLYLTALSSDEPGDRPLSLERLFPFAGRRVFAAWYTGQIRGFRTDRQLPAGSELARRYPDLILNINCGRIETISLVHSGERQKAAPSVAATAPSGESIAAKAGKVLAFMPRSADASWNPGWQGALV